MLLRPTARVLSHLPTRAALYYPARTPILTSSLARWPQPAFFSARQAYSTSSPPPSPAPPPPPSPPSAPVDKYENIYTIPNALTVARICACPAIGYFVLQGELGKATALLFVAGVSDLVDGWLARKYNMGSVLGSILDPAADKLLMTTMVVTLAMKSMLPLPLAVLIIGRDVALSLSAFYFRYASLPPPKTFTRYWDFSIPSAEVKPTDLSKYNTALQLVLVGATTISPLLPYDLSFPLYCLQWLVAGTTLGSGASYLFGSGVKFIR
ncbi:CDP-alcohol phosphatidyltransferase-domain-containing protein [Leucosporidium creatinivorum]|uniref:CDP-alcohol phosphatidyltransferase-domain-containing protein n=1 Tax=Leucosporidium creatinivorum TaxID=106004 RepID=A0A1Y2G796_9BASI|nr:CDP-alcohol phosphatidyltransferase-domain-containing protein [Leucosporidium creatinivorum]